MASFAPCRRHTDDILYICFKTLMLSVVHAAMQLQFACSVLSWHLKGVQGAFSISAKQP